MGTLSPPAMANLVPVVEIVIAMAVGLVLMMGGFWRGFRWLDDRITERHRALLKEFADGQDARHKGHERAIEDLRTRDTERASAITRLHERVDGVMELITRPP